MSLLRTAFILAAVVMLLPTDEKKQQEVVGVAGAAVERTVTFCERNPGTCAAGRELWGTFLRKAEFGMELASKLVREQMSREPSQHDAGSRDREMGQTMHGSLRLEPAPNRGTLTRNDLAPQWRGMPPERVGR